MIEDDVLLIDRMDSHPQGRERRQRHFIPVEEYLSAFVGLIRARKNLDQRRLPRAVFAAETMDLAALQIERDVLQRPHTGKGFRYVRQAQDFIHASARSDGRRLLLTPGGTERNPTPALTLSLNPRYRPSVRLPRFAAPRRKHAAS